MNPIWIVDDDASIRFVLEKALQREEITTRSFSTASEVLTALQNVTSIDEPAAVVSDIRMPGGSGLKLLEQLRSQYPHLPVIIMTAFSDLDSAVGAFQGGAFEYLAKPFDVSAAVALIRRAAASNTRTRANVSVPVQASTGRELTQEMLGQSVAMQEVFRGIGRLSQSTVNVLITGESGTGKELVAHALHKHSPRKLGAFVAINTAAIPRDLLESELFGHEKGAFTGAQATRRGRFEQAEGGTLFLDEIGDMPLELQTRLLRVLSDGQFYRVGGTNALQANVRVIAATHQDLEQRVKAGLFREDLFHRLNVIRLRLPSLRERASDIPALAQHFLARAAKQLGVDAKTLSTEAVEKLSTFGFSGNVRQLENICQWLTVMAPSSIVDLKDLPPEVLAQQTQQPKPQAQQPQAIGAPESTVMQSPAEQALDAGEAEEAGGGKWEKWEAAVHAETKSLLELGNDKVWEVLAARFERAMIQGALEHTGGKKVEAANKLGMGRNTMTRKFTELGL